LGRSWESGARAKTGLIGTLIAPSKDEFDAKVRDAAGEFAAEHLRNVLHGRSESRSRFLRQAVKVDPTMRRTDHHEELWGKLGDGMRKAA
jgi:hypothetical protein